MPSLKPKILLVQPVLPAYRVPAFSALEQRGFEVQCWSDHHPSGSLKHVDPAGKFVALHKPERKLGSWISQPALLEAARSREFDALIFCWNLRYLELVPALLLARKRGLPVLLWGHARGKNDNYVRQARNALVKLSSGCITYDWENARRLVEEGVDVTRVFCAQNAFDTSDAERALAEHAADPRALERRRQELGISGPLLLFVSRLEPHKHVDRLLHAFARLRARLPEATLAIVGDGPEAVKLRGLAGQLELGTSVRFVGAVYSPKELATWFLLARALAYPTDIGLSLLHAFSFGLPVVTVAGPEHHNPEFSAFAEGINGLSYALGDVENYASQLYRCCTDAGLQQRLSTGALETVQSEGGYNLSTMADGFERALRSALLRSTLLHSGLRRSTPA
jgi:glycosyltransferase involved in cell wall biosynthesis